MTSTTWSIGKQRFLRLIAGLMMRTGLLSIFLFVANRWDFRKRVDYRSGFPVFIGRQNHYRYQILLYHQVNDEQDPFFPAVPVKVFAAQMEILGTYFKVFPLKELVERAEKNDIPPNAVAITFDDGYQDNYENAFPILKQFDFPATIFLATGPLDSKAPLWHDRVFHTFRCTKSESIVIRGEEYRLSSIPGKQVALDAFLRDIRMRNPRDRDDMIQQLTARLGVPGQYPLSAQKLSWKQSAEMSKNNIDFGAHTVTHSILTRMPLSEAAEEIVASKKTAEKHLGVSVQLFAYPNGSSDDFNESLKEVVRESGFLGAVTTLWGTNGVQTNPFELKRVRIWDLDPEISVLRLGWYKFL
jgi:peptidoglycan/xylan/chitin deacetylase (PgdA/CDA1 family)